MVLLMAACGGSDSSEPLFTTTSAAATSSTAAPVTTAAAATTTAAPTTTTTTLPPPIIAETFDDPGAGDDLILGLAVSFEVGDGVALFRGLGEGQVGRALYPVEVGESEITIVLRNDRINDDGTGGIMMLADDPSDGRVPHYVLVYLRHDRAVIDVRFDEGWDPEGPASFRLTGTGYDPAGFNEMKVRYESGRITVFVNGVEVGTREAGLPTLSGYVGFTILSYGNGDNGDAVTIDEFTVVKLP